MATTAFPFFEIRFFTDGSTTGNTGATPAAFYTLSQFISGTTTPQTTYTDVAGAVPNVNPLTLDATGRCTMYGTPGLLYTFVLRDRSGNLVHTWDNVAPGQAALVGSFLPIAGGVMTGVLTLQADPASALDAATKQYVDTQTAAAIASVTALTNAATAAAAAATAAAAAITPTSFKLWSATGGAVTRSVTLSIGTWAVVGETHAQVDDGAVSGSYTGTTTQGFTVGTTTVNTSMVLKHIGSSGYGRNQHGYNQATGTLTVSTAGPFTMSIAAASLGSMTGTGSILSLEKQ